MPASSSAGCEPVPQGGGSSIDIPDFIFRVEEREVEHYRRALGSPGGRVPLGMALRALATEAVMSALRQGAGGRHPVHIAQEYRAERPLSAGVDYTCRVRVRSIAEARLRIEQTLSDAAGQVYVTLSSEIMLVAAT